MFLVPTELRPSPIHGIGVFLVAPVKKGELIWRFDSRIDRAYTEAEIESLPPMMQDYMKKYAVWHEPTKLWMYCGDNARYCNHADDATTTSLGGTFMDDIAPHDLKAGEEITANYRVICDKARLTGELYR